MKTSTLHSQINNYRCTVSVKNSTPTVLLQQTTHTAARAKSCFSNRDPPNRLRYSSRASWVFECAPRKGRPHRYRHAQPCTSFPPLIAVRVKSLAHALYCRRSRRNEMFRPTVIRFQFVKLPLK